MAKKGPLTPAVAAALTEIAQSFRTSVLNATDEATRSAVLVLAATVQLAFERHFDRAAVREAWEAAIAEGSGSASLKTVKS